MLEMRATVAGKLMFFRGKKALGEGREGEYEVAKVLYILRTYLNKLTLLE